MTYFRMHLRISTSLDAQVQTKKYKTWKKLQNLKNFGGSKPQSE